MKNFGFLLSEFLSSSYQDAWQILKIKSIRVFLLGKKKKPPDFVAVTVSGSKCVPALMLQPTVRGQVLSVSCELCDISSRGTTTPREHVGNSGGLSGCPLGPPGGKARAACLGKAAQQELAKQNVTIEKTCIKWSKIYQPEIIRR